eukprot:gnl/TRDRNA2_/TRDRNA2_36821_c0_seq1.p1 gnl/TRDRNA2_/TRDRNA2_36821_c0~~gnl/TRDRNA2_/TRDRNA2_36821_c0_seq1.p1  ORF type:complete len:793 (+),score=108.16 gnl/TRDRNA2_/TRDRNA2_36821_c0_seq1:78-2456(+)
MKSTRPCDAKEPIAMSSFSTASFIFLVLLQCICSATSPSGGKDKEDWPAARMHNVSGTCGSLSLDGDEASAAHEDSLRLLQTKASIHRVGTKHARNAKLSLHRIPVSSHLFPAPQRLKVKGPCCAHLSPTVRVELVHCGVAECKDVLRRAATRSQSMLRQLATRHIVAGREGGIDNRHAISTVHVSLAPGARGGTLDEHTSYSYKLVCKGSSCTIEAEDVYGAVTALQSTLLQLFAPARGAEFSHLELEDHPKYRVRGLMVDAGRRFVPKEALLHEVIDGMALVKMNFLQLHVSDFCRFAVDLPGFPELNQRGFKEGSYSVDDIREVVAYGRDRGIRVVPDVDLPGHVDGLLALKARGLSFCEKDEDVEGPEGAVKIYDDPHRKSRRVLVQLLEETASAFGHHEKWFHIGGDEVVGRGKCTWKNIAKLQSFITSDIMGKKLGRQPLAWDDMLLKQDWSLAQTTTGSKGGNPVVTLWNEAVSPEQVVQKGLQVVNAQVSTHYLDLASRPGEQFWVDPDLNINSEGAGELLGGMMAMWMDQYCYTYQCGAASPAFGSREPVASMFFQRKFDESFSRSLAGMIWPRAAVGASALWNYSPELEEGEVADRAAWIASLLIDFLGVHSCPPGCTCDELTACGKPYPVLRGRASTALNTAECFQLSEESSISFLRWEVLNAGHELDLATAQGLCFWRRECTGIACESGGRQTSEAHSCRLLRGRDMPEDDDLSDMDEDSFDDMPEADLGDMSENSLDDMPEAGLGKNPEVLFGDKSEITQSQSLWVRITESERCMPALE